MTLALSSIPGLSDLQDTALAAEKLCIGVHLNRINQNANFGLVRLEVFSGTYRNGETIPLPQSDVDGYVYRRDELMYIWTAQNTGEPNTGWATYQAPWTMWYGVWNVNQSTGEVESVIGYRGNDDHKDRQAQTTDGVLQVFVIAQRQLAGLVLASAPAFYNLEAVAFYTDRAATDLLLQKMNHNAKFAAVGAEVFYLGELAHGGTVNKPVSPIDGYAYADSELMIMTSFRWTSDTASGGPIVPAVSKGQLQDWKSSVTYGSGHYTAALEIAYELGGRHTYNEGKIAVFAFGLRAATSFSAVEDSFAELLQDVFMPGETLRASTVKQLNRNTKQAILTPEIFGPTDHVNGDTISLPTSPIDGYTYARNEIFYIWDVKNTGPATNTGDRMALWQAGISSTGVVTVNDYRLQDGAGAASLAHEGTLRVLIYAKRSIHPAHPPLLPVTPPTDPVTDSVTQTVTGYFLDSPGSSTLGDFADTVIAWPVPFADASYDLTGLSQVGGNFEGFVEYVSQTAADVTIRLTNAVSGDIATASVTVTATHG